MKFEIVLVHFRKDPSPRNNDVIPRGQGGILQETGKVGSRIQSQFHSAIRRTRDGIKEATFILTRQIALVGKFFAMQEQKGADQPGGQFLGGTGGQFFLVQHTVGGCLIGGATSRELDTSQVWRAMYSFTEDCNCACRYEQTFQIRAAVISIRNAMFAMLPDAEIQSTESVRSAYRCR